jgi:hypothetical protein
LLLKEPECLDGAGTEDILVVKGRDGSANHAAVGAEPHSAHDRERDVAR